MNKIADILDGLAKALVNDPSAVVIEISATGNGSCLRVSVAPGDLGHIVGKQGRTARSLRTILSAIGTKTGHRFDLEICEEPSAALSNNDL